MIKPQPQVTCTKYFVKLGHVVFENCERTDRQIRTTPGGKVIITFVCRRKTAKIIQRSDWVCRNKNNSVQELTSWALHCFRMFYNSRICNCRCLSVCLFVCLSVNNFVQKHLNGFAWNFREGWQWASEQTTKFWWRPHPDRDTSKTCLGGGMHCPSASSSWMFFSQNLYLYRTISRYDVKYKFTINGYDTTYKQVIFYSFRAITWT